MPAAAPPPPPPAAMAVGPDHHRNNLDALRLAFAVAVILSHAYPLATGSDLTEPLWVRSGYHTNLGRLAVAFFFVVSGFLITGSFQASRSVRAYLLKRVLRIGPGYLVAVAVTVLVVAPVAADRSTPGHEYLWRLAVRGLVGDPLLSAHVFADNPFPHAVNGPLWTIRYEFCCYLLVVLLGWAGLLRRPAAVVGLLAVVCLAAATPRLDPRRLDPLYPIVGQWAAWCRFGREFLIGMTLYLYRRRVPVHPAVAAAAVAVAVGATHIRSVVVSGAVLDVAAGYVVYCLAFARWLPLHGFGRFGDFSYGTYLYGWPIEQLLVRYGGPAMRSPVLLFAAAAPLAVMAAAASWFAVERPALRLKRRVVAAGGRAPTLPPHGQPVVHR